jgi:hypothetical protein
VQTLAQGVRADMARALVAGLVSDVASGEGEPAVRFDRLAALALLSDTLDTMTAVRLVDAYAEVAASAWRAGAEQPYSMLRRRLFEAPLATTANLNLLPDQLVRPEVFELVYAGAWKELAELARQSYFFYGRSLPDGARRHPEERLPPEREQTLRLIDWGDALAERNIGRREVGPAAKAIPLSWRHPLIEQLSKEGFNVLAEFEAAVAGGSWKEACQVVAHATPAQAEGLLPVARDSEWFLPLIGAVRLALAEHPALERTMQAEFGPIGQLRLRQAARDADTASVETITLQFLGTPAAAEAQQWLGDRALAIGDSVTARARYRAAAQDMPAAAREALAARCRLAAALLGQDEGTPVTERVTIGEVTLSAEEFERAVKNVRSQDPSVSGRCLMTGIVGSQGTLPGPMRLTARPWDHFDGEGGREADRIPRRDVDWAGCQTAVTIAGGRMIVSNRIQIAAYNLKDGQRQWVSTPLKEPGRTHALPLSVMRPLVVGDAVLVRRLTAQGVELHCLDAASGALRWQTPREQRIVSDPVFESGRLLAVTAAAPQQETLQLSLARFDLATGAVQNEAPLVQLRDLWQRDVPCEIAVADDTLVVVAGGCVLACDRDGQLRWLRRELWVAGLGDPRGSVVRPIQPVVIGRHVLTSQPGVPSLACLDLDSGAVQWRHVLPDVWRL